MIIKHKDKIVEWLLVVILLGGVAYAATTAWKNEVRLATVGEDVKSIKRSMISLLLEDAPDRAEIAKDLVSSSSTIEGIESFKVGDYEKAYKIWGAAAKSGDAEAFYAIKAAKEALLKKSESADIPDSKRKEFIHALELAPEIKEESEGYKIFHSERDIR
jgi:hypothetical protein